MKLTWRRGWWVLTSIVLTVGIAEGAAEPRRVDQVLLRVRPRSLEPKFPFPRPQVAVHHWLDPIVGITELLRVACRPIATGICGQRTKLITATD